MVVTVWNTTARRCGLGSLALILAACAGLGDTPGDSAVPRQLQSRQVIVTLAAAAPERWASIRAALASTHGVREVGAFPLSSLSVQCVVFQIAEDHSVDEVIARLAADPQVESVQPNQVFEGLGGIHADPLRRPPVRRPGDSGRPRAPLGDRQGRESRRRRYRRGCLAPRPARPHRQDGNLRAGR